MDLERIVAELESERDRISQAIAVLQDGTGVVVRRGRPPKAAPKAKGGGYWKAMSPEERSAEMTRRANVRAKNAASAKPKRG